jgi:2-polyprenyl-3-methyl-5-hydroxy-6-metoxy-1,4-benzoquinol methylase
MEKSIIKYEPTHRVLDSCRACGSKDLFLYADFWVTPLSNAYIPTNEKDKEELKFPLQMVCCKNCFLSQLSVVVNPNIMYKNYAYRSSISKTFLEHCDKLAEECVNKYNLTKEDLYVDIASNDGCLLRSFKGHNIKVLGVDPASNLSEIANKKGLTTINRYWNKETANKISQEYGKAFLITALNCFAHVDDINNFVEGVKILLKDEGIFIIEVPHFLDFIKRSEFDTCYHEHLSYYSIKPLIKLFKKHDMKIIDIKKIDIHGGTIRIYISKNINQIEINKESINKIIKLEEENNLYDPETYIHFSSKVHKIKEDLTKTLKKLKEEGKRVAGFGASAKGNMLLNYCNINNEVIDYIIDETPEKQNKLTPGMKIPILAFSHLKENPPDYLLILPWNFAKEIINKTQDFKNTGGKYIIPIPEVKIID